MVSSIVMPSVVMVVACAESYKAECSQSDADDFAHVAVSFYGLIFVKLVMLRLIIITNKQTCKAKSYQFLIKCCFFGQDTV